MQSSRDTSFSSPYYPPRASWYRRILFSEFNWFRCQELVKGRPSGSFERKRLGAFLIPGLAVYHCVPGLLGKMALGLCGLFFAVGVVWLGYGISDLAFGLMLAIHTSGLVWFCSPLFKRTFWKRILGTLAALAALCLFLYLPLGMLARFFIVPLRLNGGVVVIDRFFSPGQLRRGDWIAYELDEDRLHGENGVWIHAGMGLGPILAGPGDRVEFFDDKYTVNNVVCPRSPNMPRSGTLMIRENQWFLWPRFGMNGQGIKPEMLAAILARVALVDKGQLVGKPYQTWFGREQKL